MGQRILKTVAERMRKITRIWPGLLLVLMSVALPTFAQEGWLPVGPPNITNLNLQTVGGITYMTHTSLVEGCRRVAPGAITRSGTNLFQAINEEQWLGFCVCEFCAASETHVSVFGLLPAGGYFLQLSSTGGFNPGPFRWLSFVVPPADAPTLQASLETNQFKLHVTGIPKVTYTVEATAALTNWVAVFTNNGGPFTWSQPLAPNTPQRFYRVKIVGQ
jgi:hypothetical protein